MLKSSESTPGLSCPSSPWSGLSSPSLGSYITSLRILASARALPSVPLSSSDVSHLLWSWSMAAAVLRPVAAALFVASAVLRSMAPAVLVASAVLGPVATAVFVASAVLRPMAASAVATLP